LFPDNWPLRYRFTLSRYEEDSSKLSIVPGTQKTPAGHWPAGAM
jgi:hypothetical protein